jgi:hypothetical protein
MHICSLLDILSLTVGKNYVVVVVVVVVVDI